VQLWGSREFPLPVAFARDVRPDAGEVSLVFDDAAASLLKLAIVHGDGDRPAATVVRAWSLDAGSGTTLRPPVDDGFWRLGMILAGWYRVEAFVAGSGWTDLGRHWVGSHVICDLGRCRTPPAAVARFDLGDWQLAAGEDSGAELYEVRDDLDVRLHTGPLPHDARLPLAAGSYALAWRRADGTVRFHRFAVRASEAVTVTPGQR
jgi:hypothetical protein